MNKTARIQKRLVLLIAFSIAWIFIGSLVIFHQEHVMGKVFKWHSISFLVPKSKVKTFISFADDSNSDTSDNEAPAAVSETPKPALSSNDSLAIIPVIWRETLADAATGMSSGLRAPPAA